MSPLETLPSLSLNTPPHNNNNSMSPHDHDVLESQNSGPVIMEMEEEEEEEKPLEYLVEVRAFSQRKKGISLWVTIEEP
jgi:hypothetical protein